MSDIAQDYWWEQKWAHALLLLLLSVPLLYPTVPPLVDLPGHMGRYRVELDQGLNTPLTHFYHFQWQLIGNLGIDLLIIPVAKIFGLELGTKLIIMSIPVLTGFGTLWIAREVHGKVTPTALFALPFAYAHPFMFGFVNYTLSMALALNAFALWLRLERLGRYRLRALLFLFIAPGLWICHIYGWAALCLLAASAEIVHQHDKRGAWLPALFHAALNGIPLAPPILLMLMWRSGAVAGQTAGWFIWQTKLAWFTETLRDHWFWFDIAWLIMAVLVLAVGVLEKFLSYSRNLAASAIILLIMYILIPYVVFGSAYADMRLTPFIFIIALVGIRIPEGTGKPTRRILGLLGLAYFGIRTAGTTLSFAQYASRANRAMVALEHVPYGSRLLSIVGRTCATPWSTSHLEHIPAMAMVRREAFSDDQWDMEGAQLLRSVYPVAQGGPWMLRAFAHDPAQMGLPDGCPLRIEPHFSWSMRNFPRDSFDYVWLMDPVKFDPRLLSGMHLIWQDGPY
ncbi:MAG: hypothetical protein KGJ05_07280, partial [Alphaproteobacteria bacterium]|nr:hypothetical protein [Alphaproteobacteria bacterium]